MSHAGIVPRAKDTTMTVSPGQPAVTWGGVEACSAASRTRPLLFRPVMVSRHLLCRTLRGRSRPSSDLFPLHLNPTRAHPEGRSATGTHSLASALEPDRDAIRTCGAARETRTNVPQQDADRCDASFKNPHSRDLFSVFITRAGAAHHPPHSGRLA